MIRYLIRRIPSIAIVIFLSSIVAFLLPRLAPGDPAIILAGNDSNPEVIAAIRKDLGLDRPLIEQYLNWVSAFSRGDLGISLINKRPIGELILARAESTLELAGLAAIFMILLALILGVLGGSLRSKFGRSVLDFVSTTIVSMPAFLVGLILIVVFGVILRVLPVSGQLNMSEDFWGGLEYLLLPAISIALSHAAVIARLLQTSMLTNRGEEFVDLAVVKGASPKRITFRHVLPASLDTAIVAIGLRIGELIGGAIIIEAIFSRSGLGQLMIQSINTRDYFVVQALVIGAVIIAIISQLISEIVVASLDPRIRLEA
jgi:peptide/nickel transport system permease protein